MFPQYYSDCAVCPFIGSAESLVNHISSLRLQLAVSYIAASCEMLNGATAVLLSAIHQLCFSLEMTCTASSDLSSHLHHLLYTDNVVAFWLDNHVGTHRETEGLENERVCLSISHDTFPSHHGVSR